MVLCLIDVKQPGQPKVSDLDVVGALDEDIASGQVPVHQSHLLQITHSLRVAHVQLSLVSPTTPQSCPGPLSYLGNLHTPVEQVLGADVVLVLPHVVQEAAIGHQLRHQLHRGGQADAQQPGHVGAAHPCHHIGLLWAGGGLGWRSKWAGAAASPIPRQCCGHTHIQDLLVGFG